MASVINAAFAALGKGNSKPPQPAAVDTKDLPQPQDLAAAYIYHKKRVIALPAQADVELKVKPGGFTVSTLANKIENVINFSRLSLLQIYLKQLLAEEGLVVDIYDYNNVPKTDASKFLQEMQASDFFTLVAREKDLWRFATPEQRKQILNAIIWASWKENLEVEALHTQDLSNDDMLSYTYDANVKTIYTDWDGAANVETPSKNNGLEMSIQYMHISPWIPIDTITDILHAGQHLLVNPVLCFFIASVKDYDPATIQHMCEITKRKNETQMQLIKKKGHNIDMLLHLGFIIDKKQFAVSDAFKREIERAFSRACGDIMHSVEGAGVGLLIKAKHRLSSPRVLIPLLINWLMFNGLDAGLFARAPMTLKTIHALFPIFSLLYASSMI
jgi:hypothetical protein